MILKNELAYIVLIFIALLFSCTPKERKYRSKMNGIQYGHIHEMGGGLSISINKIDTISQNTLVNFLHCLESESSRAGSQIDFIEIYDKFLYIDQIRPENCCVRVHFKPDTTMEFDKRKVVLEYMKQKRTIEVEYDPYNLKCYAE